MKPGSRQTNLNDQLDRRRFIQGSAVTALTAAASCAGPGGDSGGRETAIELENRNPGTRDWQLTRVWVDRGSYRSAHIEGYCSHQSIEAGDTLSIFVSTDPASPFRLDVYRMGYYGGHGGRLMKTAGPLEGNPQPLPEIGPNRLRECRWEPSLEFKIPEDWTSGIYLGKLTTLPAGNQPYWQSYVIFIVRDRRPAHLLFQCSDNTWQAYNRWPDDYSLYTHPEGAHHPGVAASFDRPYAKFPMFADFPLSVGTGEFLLWEYPLCYWLEREGLDVTYCSNCDVLEPSFVTRCGAFVSVGHDEYWDLAQYRTIETAIGEGLNVIWLSANDVYMVSPFSPSSIGAPNRIITRLHSYGPLRPEEVERYSEILGPFEGAGPDERNIIGARTVVPFNGSGDWICTAPDHWIFEGTGMAKGDFIPGLVGWEFHGDPDLEREGLEVVAQGTVWTHGVTPGEWAATIFPGPKGNFVFNASTIFWAQGLDSPPGHTVPWTHFTRPLGPDPRVQRITRNLIDRAAAPNPL